ncbi:MAG: DUF805 domain-containing protein [Hyphomonadaceae bacterium]|nr:DUF805 domain-containing protein [Hyphomonadaceae bacterium]
MASVTGASGGEQPELNLQPIPAWRLFPLRRFLLSRLRQPARGTLLAAANRQVSFGEALPLFFKNFANFQGRSSRGAYWWLFLINFLIAFGLGLVDGLVFTDFVMNAGIGVLGGLWSLAVLIPGISLGFRRLHDVDKSAWWLLIGLIPIVGAIVLIIFAIQEGTPGTNKFGPDEEAGRPPGEALKGVFE